MKRSSSGRRRGLISGVAISGFAIAALMLFIPSAGAANIVSVQSPGYLRARGVAVETTVMVTCSLRTAHTVGAYSTPAHASLTVALAERVGKRVAGGTVKVTTHNHDFRCDGNSHQVNVTVTAKSGGPAFAKGSAFAEASLRVCAPTCRLITDEQSIRLR